MAAITYLVDVMVRTLGGATYHHCLACSAEGDVQRELRVKLFQKRIKVAKIKMVDEVNYLSDGY